jgi:hypothetical protein
MPILWTNNASGALASSISTSSTTIVLAAGQGVEFPTPGGGNYFYATLTDTSNNLEVVKVTARTVDTLTVVRGQDGTAARSYAAGDLLELRPTAAGLTDMQAYTPSGNITAGTIVGAIAELDSEKAGLALNNTFSGNNQFNGNNTYKTTNWTINEQSGKLVFSEGGIPKFSMDSAGVFTAVGDVTSEGTI